MRVLVLLLPLELGVLGELAINSGEDNLDLVTRGDSVSDSERLAFPRVLLLGLPTVGEAVVLELAPVFNVAFFDSLPLPLSFAGTCLFPLLVTGLLMFSMLFLLGVSFSDFS